jgi:hypothetical protein
MLTVFEDLSSLDIGLLVPLVLLEQFLIRRTGSVSFKKLAGKPRAYSLSFDESFSGRLEVVLESLSKLVTESSRNELFLCRILFRCGSGVPLLVQTQVGALVRFQKSYQERDVVVLRVVRHLRRIMTKFNVRCDEI